MKKLFIVLLLLAGSQAFAEKWVSIKPGPPSPAKIEILGTDGENSTVRFSFGGFSLNMVKGAVDGSCLVDLPGSSRVLIKGEPDLPKLTASLVIPDLADMDAEVTFSQYVDYHDINIAPSKGNLTRDIDPASVPFTYGKPYTVNADYPGRLTSLNDPYILRDYRGQTIVVYPFQYNPVTRTLRVFYDVIVQLKKKGDNGKNPLAGRNVNHRVVNEFYDIYKHHFLNFSTPKYNPVTEEGSMLIISYGEFIPHMQPFIDWKISKGIAVEIIDVATIGNASEIKAFLQSYYLEHNLAFVLIVGDHEQVPTYMAPNGPSDNFYTYVAGNDHYNDLLIGRFSAQNSEQVRTQVDKVLYYEINPSLATNWFESCVGIASSQGPGDDNEDDYQHIRALQTQCNNYTYNTLYEYFDGSQGGLDAPGNPASSMVADGLNAGASLIVYCGHGSTNSWSSSGFSSSDVNNLNNGGMLPFIWSVACVNGNFTGGDCFAEAWLRARQGDELTGAIATLMSTINQSWDPPMEGQDEMVSILTENNVNNIKRTFGGLSVNGMAKMIDSYSGDGESMADTWVLFGDPSVVVRTAVPAPITSTHDSLTTLGMSAFQVSCPVEGALACISLNNEILGTALVSGGLAIIEYAYPLMSLDTLKLVITKFNHIPYIATIPVVSPSGPFVVCQSHMIDDLYGNNNGMADYGENIIVGVTLKNLGIAAASAVSTVLSTNDAFVSLTDSIQSFGDIDSSSVVVQDDSYSFLVANNIPDQHKVLFSLSISDIDGHQWNSFLKVTVNAPSFKINNLTIIDSSANNNGNPDPGETLEIDIPSLNLGHGSALSTIGTLLSSSPYITINNSTYDLDTLAAGETKIAKFNITISPLTPLCTNIDLQYTLTSGAYTTQKTFYKVVGIIDETFESGDFTHYNWQSSGSSLPWTITTENPYEGQYCSRSGAIDHGQQSVLSLTVTVLSEDSLSFYRRVSSENDYDYLTFYIDGIKKNEWSGEKPWERFAYIVLPGAHTFTWTYSKDYMVAAGLDAAWIDDIVFPPLDISTGITADNRMESKGIWVFPNPAADICHFSVIMEQRSELESALVDAMGRTVRLLAKQKDLPPGDYSFDISLHGIQPGMYFIRTMANNQIYTTKLILK